MIPNLKDLPPLVVEEENRLKKLIRPLLITSVMLGLAGGVIWLYTVGIRQSILQELSSMSGLQSIAGELWLTGTAQEVRFADPGLSKEISRLRASVGSPDMVVSPAESTSRASASHQFLYLKNKKPVLSVWVFWDETEQKADILSFQTNPEFAGPPAP